MPPFIFLKPRQLQRPPGLIDCRDSSLAPHLILNITDSDKGLSSGWCQAIIWTNAGILSIWPLGTNFSEMLIKIQIFSFQKMHVKMSSAERRPFCLNLSVKTYIRAWISDYIQHFLCDVITYPCHNFNGSLTAIEVRTWMSNYGIVFIQMSFNGKHNG